MSSAANHAKRSHRSESRRMAYFNVSGQRAYIKATQKAQRAGILKRLARFIRKRGTENSK